jgi:hypothetical protein
MLFDCFLSPCVLNGVNPSHQSCHHPAVTLLGAERPFPFQLLVGGQVHGSKSMGSSQRWDSTERPMQVLKLGLVMGLRNLDLVQGTSLRRSDFPFARRPRDFRLRLSE